MLIPVSTPRSARSPTGGTSSPGLAPGRSHASSVATSSQPTAETPCTTLVRAGRRRPEPDANRDRPPRLRHTYRIRLQASSDSKRLVGVVGSRVTRSDDFVSELVTTPRQPHQPHLNPTELWGCAGDSESHEELRDKENPLLITGDSRFLPSRAGRIRTGDLLTPSPTRLIPSCSASSRFVGASRRFGDRWGYVVPSESVSYRGVRVQNVSSRWR